MFRPLRVWGLLIVGSVQISGAWRVARPSRVPFFRLFMFYVICNGLGADMKYCSRGIVRVEILYSSLVELLVMSCKFFILNIKKYIYTILAKCPWDTFKKL